MLTLADVLRGAEGSALAFPASSDLSLNRVTQDSRLVKEGDLFVALRAERDGHNFIADAFTRGARAVLAQRVVPLYWLPSGERGRLAYVVVPDTLAALQQLAAYWLRKNNASVVAVTGSVGKTTTKEAIAAILGRRYQVLKSEGNLNNEIGLPLTLLRLTAEHERAVVEMGMYAVGEIAGLCGIARPRIGVVTNVGPSHLERLGSLDRIALAKSELVSALPRDGFAVLNGDDHRVAAMARLTPARALAYGLGRGCDLRASDIVAHGLRGTSFTLHYADAAIPIFSPLPGAHNVYTCLAAAAVGHLEGLSWTEIRKGLAAGRESGRIVTLRGRNGATIIDDTYNASPASVKAALDLLATLPGRRIAVLGEMLELGEAEEEGHREVGAHAAERVDHLVVVGERARWIGEQAMTSGLREVAFAAKKDEVSLDLKPGDFVLIKGSRAMAMEMLVSRLREPEVSAR